jgi:hypothetical protein
MVGAEQGNFEKFESLDRWKWHFQSLLYLFGIMICESMLFVIIEIRTLDMVFKFRKFFNPPAFSRLKLFWPLVCHILHSTIVICIYWYICFMFFTLFQIGFCILSVSHNCQPQSLLTSPWRTKRRVRTGILKFTHMTFSTRFIYFTCLHTSFLVQHDHTLWVWSKFFTQQDIFWYFLVLV